MVELYLSSEVSYQELALSHGINNPSIIAKWVNDFRIAGPDALRPKKKGRKKTLDTRELKKLSYKVSLECEKFEKEFGRAPLVSELSDKMNMPKYKIAEALMVKNPVVRESEENTERFFIADEFCEKNLVEKLALKDIYYKLTKSEKELIYLRFFLCKTQSEVAGLFGVSQMQISRKERKILLYIRGVFKD